MEIVTHPMTLDYHMHFCWERIMKRAIALGYRSHQTSTCGLHIHVNRNSLSENYDEQESIISRILYFVEHHWNELLKFSRRSEATMSRSLILLVYIPSQRIFSKDVAKIKLMHCSMMTISSARDRNRLVLFL